MKADDSINTNASKIPFENNNTIQEAKQGNTQEQKHQQFELIYSPRSTYSNELDYQEVLFNDLTLNFDPITIKIIKKHFKERLGSLSIIQFIAILKNHLLSWHPNLPNREKILIRLLHRLFQEIDLNDNGSMEWSEFCNYIIHNSNNLTGITENGTFKNKLYSLSKLVVDTKEYIETISYMTYIEKLNLIGVVEDGKSIIYFFDANTYKKTKTMIDIKDIQRDMDLLEAKELDTKMKQLAKEKMKKFKYEALSPSEKKRKKHKNDNSINNNLKDLSFDEESSSESSDSSNNLNSKIKNDKRKKFEKEDINLHESYKKVGIITTYYIKELDLLMVSQSNKKITAWKYSAGEFVNDNNMKLNTKNDNIHSTYELFFTLLPQYCITWDPINKNLYTGQEDGKIHKWDLFKAQPVGILDIETVKEETEKEVINKKKKSNIFLNEMKKKTNKYDKNQKFKKKRQYETRDFVTNLLVINKIQVLAASYLNGKIILWDTLLMNKRKQYKNKLETGIYELVYDNSKNLLFACGFDSTIMVYDPYIESEIYELEGHMVSINKIVVNEKENELVSYDINGNIKVWDTNTFNCTQTLTPYEGQNNVSHNKNKKANYKTKSGIAINKKSKQILCFRKHEIKIYEVDKSLNPNLCDDQVVFSSFYDTIAKLVITICLRKIKMWNPFTGKINRIYDDPMKAEITALALDPSYKRVFLGDNNGNIKCFNMKNGKFLKDLDSHENSEISILIHSQVLEKVISASIDNVFKIHDDKELTESVLIKELKVLTYNIKSMILMENLSRLVIGLSSGICKFYDIEHFRYDSDIHSDTGGVLDEVTAMYHFNNFTPDFVNDPDYKRKHLDNKKDKNDDSENDTSHNYNLILSSHSSGKIKLMWTPPYALKFNVIYEFVHLNICSDDSDIMKGIVKKNVDEDNEVKVNNNSNNHSNIPYNSRLSKKLSSKGSKAFDHKDKNNNTEEEKDFGHHTPVTCLEFDYENKCLFTGDQIGKIRCYDFTDIFEEIDNHLKLADSKNKKYMSNIHNYNTGNGTVKAKTLWYVEAHKESIKHIHYANIDPKILITTSHDLRVKIFKVSDGSFIDELKQGANKYPPVPIGIKYKGVDPITKTPYEKVVWRKELNQNHYNTNIDDLETNHLADYSEKISVFNAKEKLLSYVKNTKVEPNKSNSWNFMIDIDSIRKLDNDEMNDAYQIVKEKESLILKTEMMMQETSIYSENYKPLFIYEMDENSIKEFSKLLNQKLRHVKLAISKANLGQNKYKTENETSMILNSGPANPRSDNISKHLYNPKIFMNNKGLFTYDKYAKEIYKDYEEKIKVKEELIMKEKGLSKIKENIEERNKIKESLETIKQEINKIKPKIESNFNEKHFKPTASRNLKLPDIKQGNNKYMYDKQKEKSKAVIVNYKNINSKYKSKDKMSVAEMFDSYKDECSDFMLSLINPFSKLAKYTKKDNNTSNVIKSLVSMQNLDNIGGYENTGAVNNHDSFNMKMKNYSISKQSEEMSEFSSPKK